MTPWIAFAAITAAALALLLWPLLRRRADGEASRLEYDLQVFRDQLAEVAKDVEAGLVPADQAEATQLEIKRRMLRASGQAETAVSRGFSPASKVVAGLVAVVVPLGSFALYSLLGAPQMRDMPYTAVQASRLGVDPQGAAQIQAMVDKLAKRLDDNPNDADGWAMLGRSYKSLGRFDDAIDALRRSMELTEKPSADTLGTLGEVMVASAQGMVGPDARQVFLQTLQAWSRDPRARFYLGLSRAQIGDAAGAIAVWKDLEADSDEKTPWIGVLRDQIKKTAAAAGLDPAAIQPKPETALLGTASPGAAGGNAPAMARGGDAAEAQPEVIRQRVENLARRLESEPGDGDGWAMLGRSYQAMGEKAKSKAAYAKAVAVKPKDVGILMSYAETLLADSPDQDAVPADFVAVMRQVLAVDPAHPDALYYVGLSEAQAGRKGEARKHWNALLKTLMPRTEEYEALSKEIQALGPER